MFYSSLQFDQKFIGRHVSQTELLKKNMKMYEILVHPDRTDFIKWY